MINPDYKYRAEVEKIGGDYISLSGLDGSGKTTQAKLLQQALMIRGYSAFIAHHRISDNEFFERALKYLYNSSSITNINQEYVSSLIAFEYLGFFLESISPRLGHEIAILDRAAYDLFVSQTTIFGCDFEIGQQIIKETCMSGLHFFIDVSPDICYARIQKRADQIKQHETLDALTEKYEVYKKLVEQGILISIDGTLSKLVVHNNIVNQLQLYKMI